MVAQQHAAPPVAVLLRAQRAEDAEQRLHHDHHPDGQHPAVRRCVGLGARQRAVQLRRQQRGGEVGRARPGLRVDLLAPAEVAQREPEPERDHVRREEDEPDQLGLGRLARLHGWRVAGGVPAAQVMAIAVQSRCLFCSESSPNLQNTAGFT